MIRNTLRNILIRLSLYEEVHYILVNVRLLLLSLIFYPYRFVYSYLAFTLQKKYDSLGADTKTISLLCPTRGHPLDAARLVSNVQRTVRFPERIEILFYIDSDDPFKNDYLAFLDAAKKKIRRLMRCEAIVGERMNISKSWNALARECKGELLFMANDDKVYVDYGWDMRLDKETKKFPDGIFCMWFNDIRVAEFSACFPVVSRVWYETLGYFTPDVFEFYINNTWIWDIANRIGCLHYIPDVHIVHPYMTFYSFAKSLLKVHRQYTPIRKERVVDQQTKMYWRDNLLFHAMLSRREEEAKKLKAIIDSHKSNLKK